jgi:hypothetical protein
MLYALLVGCFVSINWNENDWWNIEYMYDRKSNFHVDHFHSANIYLNYLSLMTIFPCRVRMGSISILASLMLEPIMMLNMLQEIYKRVMVLLV